MRALGGMGCRRMAMTTLLDVVKGSMAGCKGSLGETAGLFCSESLSVQIIARVNEGCSCMGRKGVGGGGVRTAASLRGLANGRDTTLTSCF